MLRRIGFSLFGAVVAVLLAGNLLLGLRLQASDQPEGEESAFEYMELLTETLQKVRNHYVDRERTGYRDLFIGALQGMLASLDEHSMFMQAEMYEDMQDDAQGHFGGLGIVVGMRDEWLTIISPMEDTPGFKAGLQAGDRILEVDGESTDTMDLSDAVHRLRGEPGSKVSLTIERPEPFSRFEVDVERAVIEVSSVKGVEMLDDSIGYLRITQFTETTADDVRDAIRELRDQSMKGLVLDLRGNPGGLLSSAVDTAQLFLNRNDLIVFTRGREERREQQFSARGKVRFMDFHIAVLVNGGSASASEIVAGALQDHRRAVLVGVKTFGKGSVQSVLPVGDDSAIRLTTAKYYTPSERVIHNRGIEPDISVPISPENWRTIQLQRMRSENGETPDPDEEEVPAEPVEDTQLQRALEVLQGILIFETNNASPLQYTPTV